MANFKLDKGLAPRPEKTEAHHEVPAVGGSISSAEFSRDDVQQSLVVPSLEAITNRTHAVDRVGNRVLNLAAVVPEAVNYVLA